MSPLTPGQIEALRDAPLDFAFDGSTRFAGRSGRTHAAADVQPLLARALIGRDLQDEDRYVRTPAGDALLAAETEEGA
jgi:hypothetical protein